MRKVELWRQSIELRHGRPFEVLVTEQVEAGKSQEEIAQFLGLPYWSFRYLLRHSGGRFTKTISFDPDESVETASVP